MGKSQASAPEAEFELGKLYCDRGDFKIAIDRLRVAADGFYQAKNFGGFLKCINLLLRMYAEMEDYEAIDATKERLQDLVIKEKVELTSRTYYTLGTCASHKGQHKTSLEFLEKALALALAADDKESVCCAISGLAIVYTALGRYEDALKEIYNLQVFFQVMPLPEMELASQMLNGHILRKTGKYEQAIEVFWRCYESLRQQKNLYMYVSLLYAMGVTFVEAGDKDMGRMYLTLAKRSADPENLKRCTRVLDERLEALGAKKDSQYDIVFQNASKSIVERRKGRIDFRNQFILLDLLRLFLRNPGQVYSKEHLVERVWKQNYDPAVHDNKIYVTIKRLRKMIEPDYDKPRYIFRAKNGYYLNKGTKVLLE